MKIKFGLFVVSLFFMHNLFSQNVDFKVYEDSLKRCFAKIAATNNKAEKEEINNKVIDIFKHILSDDDSFDYPFDSLKYVGKMYSDDKKLRIYNWNLSHIDGTFSYYGFLQYYHKQKKKFLVYPLIDKKNEIAEPKTEVLSADRWFGALYYQIIHHTYKKRDYYTLLGWDGNDLFTNRKVVEILSFSGSGVPRFGAPLIKANRKLYKRLIFEYSNRVSMLLKYFPKDKRIVFDHLSPAEPKYKDMYQYYGPDFSYDSFVLEKGRWYFKGDIDFRNPDKFNEQKAPSDGL